jgi:3-methyladenine DNA glycosylase/8-oxoguanine DNA glycosylase
MRERTIALDGPLDMVATVRAMFMKGGSSTLASRSEVWRAGPTPAGPGTIHLRHLRGEVLARAWGPGAAWHLEHVPDLLGLHDDPAGFTPPPGLIHELHRRSPGLRIGRTGQVFETLLPTILGQKVTGLEAKSAYRRLVGRFGDPAPGPVELRLQPQPEVLAALSYEDFHSFGVERKRAATIIEAARRAGRLEAAVGMDPTAADRRIQAVRGIGPWSSAFVMGIALGDPDAIPVGDYHLPNTIAWALAGEDRATDDRMLELLEPYRGHRRRVMLLVKGAGINAPRYGPRTTVRGIERI